MHKRDHPYWKRSNQEPMFFTQFPLHENSVGSTSGQPLVQGPARADLYVVGRPYQQDMSADNILDINLKDPIEGG